MVWICLWLRLKSNMLFNCSYVVLRILPSFFLIKRFIILFSWKGEFQEKEENHDGIPHGLGGCLLRWETKQKVAISIRLFSEVAWLSFVVLVFVFGHLFIVCLFTWTTLLNNNCLIQVFSF